MDDWFDHLYVDKDVEFTDEEQKELQLEINRKIGGLAKEEPNRFSPFRRLMPYAASILLLLLAGGTYLYFSKQVSPEEKVQAVLTEIDPSDIYPGGNKATLELSDGRIILLADNKDGIRSDDGFSYVDGTRIFEGADQDNNDIQQFAILSTPNGGQYQVILPDGSTVWLNSASTLRYPTRFRGNTREVELIGEAYFDVTSLPDNATFIVRTASQVIEVHGTEFNISAYSNDHETRTTLVEGSVSAYNPRTNAHMTLLPGEESVSTVSTIRVRRANVAAAIAWRSGIFHFDNTPFSQMMKQISRWYDLEIIYQGDIPTERFSGKMSREVSLKALFDFLKDSGISLKVEENRKLIIGP